MELNNESKTLFIPLLGKAQMSKENLFLEDKKAEEIVNKLEYDFNKLKQSKWLSMYMALRAKLIDDLIKKYIKEKSQLLIIHLGCGLDSRCLRVENFNNWYDVDFENVIELRKDFYKENDKYKMIGKSVLDYSWINDIIDNEKVKDEEVKNKNKNILIVVEGLTMYLSEEEISNLINVIYNKLCIENNFNKINIIFDAYSKKAVKLSKIKNPVNQMNANVKWGMDDENDFLKLNKNIKYINKYYIEKKDNNLKGIIKFIFNKLYCGKFSRKLYKIYKFELSE